MGKLHRQKGPSKWAYALGLVCLTSSIQGQNVNGTWSATTSGVWTTSSNWVSGIVPTGPLGEAVFPSVGAAPITVTLGTAINIGTVWSESTTGGTTYTIGSSTSDGPLQMGGNSYPNPILIYPTSPASAANLVVNSPITLLADLNVSIANTTNTPTITLNGVISGGFNVYYNDFVYSAPTNGTYVVNGANTYTGATTLGGSGSTANGIVQFVPGEGIPSSSAITAYNGTLQPSASGTVPNSVTIASSSSLTIDTTTANTGVTFSGPVTVPANGATTVLTVQSSVANTPLILSNASNALSGVINLPSSTSSLQFGNTMTVSSPITGSGSVNIAAGSGNIVTLSGASSYTGTTSLISGTLSISAADNIGTGGTLALAGGTLLGTNSITLSNLVTISSPSYIAVSANQTMILSSLVSGSSSLTFQGAGLLELNASNTGFAGGLIVTGGSVGTTVSEGLGAAGNTVTLNGGDIQLVTSYVDLPVNIAFNSGNGINMLGNSAALSGVISGNSSPFPISGSSPGQAITLTNTANTYAGTISMEGTGCPQLEIAPSGTTTVNYSVICNVGTPGADSFVAFVPPSAATITMTGIISEGSITPGSSSIAAGGSGTTILTANNNYAGGVNVGSALTLSPTTSATYSGVFTGTASLTIGAGTVLLSGNSPAPGFISPIAVGIRAILQVGQNTVLGSGQIHLDTNAGIDAIGSLTLANNISISGSMGIFFQSYGETLTLSGLLSGSGELDQQGPGTLAITNSGNSGFTGSIGIFGSTLQTPGGTTLGTGEILLGGTLQPTGSSPTITNPVLLDPSATIDLSQLTSTTATISGPITGTGTLNLTGPSTNILSLTNTGNSGAAWGVNLEGGILSFAAMTNIGTGMITFNGGTLQTAGAGLTIPNSVSITSGVLDLDGHAIETFSGAFTGSGILNVRSSGVSSTPTLNLTNSTGGNSFSGTVVLNNPTALNVAPTATTAISYGITAASSNTNGLALSFAPAGGTILTVNGAISGPTAVAVNSGTVAMPSSLTNSYTGSSFITSSTLQIGSATNLAGGGNVSFGGTAPILELGSSWVSSGAIVNSLAVNVASLFDLNAQMATLAGGMSGIGDLTLTGAGTLILAPSPEKGYSGYTGTLNVNNGVTLQSDVAAIPITILNDGNLNFQLGSGGSGTYGGTVTGTGALALGSGALNLAGGSVTQGSVTISSGAVLAVNEAVTMTTATVNSGGRLKGTGTITGAVTNHGTLSPGNSPGTIAIVGSYVQASGSSFNVEMNATQFSQLQVSGAPGTVTIDSGAVVSVLLDPSSPTLPAAGAYPIITTTGGVSGTFATLSLSLPGIVFSGSLSYPLDEVVLNLSLAPFHTLVMGGNAGSIANCFAYLAAQSLQQSNATQADLANVLKALALAPDASTLRSDFDQLQPALFSGFTIAQQEVSIKVLNALAQAGDLWDKNRCAVEWREDHSVRSWVQPFGEFTKQNATGSEQVGFSSTTGGIVAGADYKLPHHFYLGAGAAYSYSDVDFQQHRGDGSIRSYYGGLYTNWTTHLCFAELSILGAYNNYHGNRNIRIDNNPAFAINRTASHSQGGYEVAGHLGGGGLFQISCGTQFTPFVSFDYIFLHQNDYREYGAQGLDLSVREKRANYLRAVGGLTISHCFTIKGGKLVPDLKLSYVREERTNGAATEAGIPPTAANLGQCFFIVKGMNPSRNIFAPGVGLSWLSKEMHYSVTARYNGEFSSHYMDNEAILQVGVNF